MVKQGTVYLVGAGPGDKELLTVKGQRLLREADVVIFDRLVNPYLLTELKGDAKIIYCGKQPCKHLFRQEDIQTEMLIHAKKGKVVVRLKGGDPAVFGRVGEEAAVLKANGVDYEIVPGVTSGTAASMYAGVPVTHRDYSGSFAVVTAHRKTQDGKPDVQWKSLAESVDSILFYMGVKQIDTIASELIKYGKKKETPVLVIQWGTYSRQRSVKGTLSTITEKVATHKITNPAMILVGEVIRVREKVAWFESKPLSGMGMLIPSVSENTEKETTLLKRHGADVYTHNLREEKKGQASDSEIELALAAGKDQALVFTNPKSINSFLQTMGERGLDIRGLHGVLTASNECVQEAFERLGFQVPLFQERTWLAPLYIGNAKAGPQPFAAKTLVAMTRLIEEGHINAVLCRSRQDVTDVEDFLKETHLYTLCSDLHVFTTSLDVQSHARLLPVKKITTVCFEGDEAKLLAGFAGRQLEVTQER
ncbi:uroporphyrinogen-III C-methyltransferase [Shouchella shacheensis]|uniref:uroporphyrinogen-III C-methyltransferase n=1 Tax=Shouchella shacheensis TaxID=1649580 RepID=UPI0009E8E634|nr:uroporphyrinogen-III C-methyltransferase [Shouchella shacheensis]